MLREDRCRPELSTRLEQKQKGVIVGLHKRLTEQERTIAVLRGSQLEAVAQRDEAQRLLEESRAQQRLAELRAAALQAENNALSELASRFKVVESWIDRIEEVKVLIRGFGGQNDGEVHRAVLAKKEQGGEPVEKGRGVQDAGERGRGIGGRE